MSLKCTIRTSQAFEDLTRRLRDADSSIRRDATDGCRRAGAATVKKVRESAKRIRVRGFAVKNPRSRQAFTAETPGGHIRQRIARAVIMRVRLVRMPVIDLYVDTAKLGNASKLPEYFEDERKFYHPLPGTRRQWAAVQGTRWFRSVVRKDLPKVRREIDQQLNRTRAELDGRR